MKHEKGNIIVIQICVIISFILHFLPEIQKLNSVWPWNTKTQQCVAMMYKNSTGCGHDAAS